MSQLSQNTISFGGSESGLEQMAQTSSSSSSLPDPLSEACSASFGAARACKPAGPACFLADFDGDLAASSSSASLSGLPSKTTLFRGRPASLLFLRGVKIP